jgi:YVTN family beta-propeller protein
VRNLLLIALSVGSATAVAADLPYVNWENHPVHALDLSPDRSTLAVAHTADQRVQLFDLTTGAPVSIGHVVVGVDPVSVRFRNGNELWVVNHISDTVSVVDVARRQVIDTLATADEPFDVVFAGNRAFVSCSQANEVRVFNAIDRTQPGQTIAILGEDPRALAVSNDGRSVYVAVFESGNATTLLAGGLADNVIALPNAVSDPRGPYAGQNPPPNAGTAFDPPLHPQAIPPRVGLIVRKGSDLRWRDDNNRDWSEFVSGSLAAASGRITGWDMPDRDLGIIDADSLSVRYVSGLMNIGMALAVNPQSGIVTLTGTDARNELRFEPKVKGQFVRTMLARVDASASPTKQLSDLNGHLDYSMATAAQQIRDLSISDPRAILWRGDGQRGWIAGMGSNHVIAIDASGQRVGAPVAVGQGPLGLALDEPRARLYVWNHFDASLSVIDTSSNAELQRVTVFNPLPQAIRDGRPMLYDTHRTSGLGQASCASCHVDARMDRLAWDLGDPSQAPAVFDQNCLTIVGTRDCEDFHAMKGPMTTQTLQDIIGHEPFHWRGDRAGIEAFNPAFEGLLGDDRQLTAAEMQAFEHFLATISFPPNPYRNTDNTLPSALALNGHYTSGRFAMAGLPLGTGDANRGLRLYTRGLLDNVFQCGSCHSLPTGMAVNGPLFLGVLGFTVGGTVMPIGAMGENHLGIVSTDGSTNVSIKVPQLRNQYDKVGMDLGKTESRAGFGFLHDGSVDSISRFVSARTFSVRSDQEVADLVALMLAFAGSDFGDANAVLGGPAPLSRDTHAAVGRQARVTAATAATSEMLALARTRKVDLIVHAGARGFAFDAVSDRFVDATDAGVFSDAALIGLASTGDPQTWSIVPAGLGKRLGVDRDGDGVGDAREIAQGSDPANALSSAVRLASGLWYNPQRSGHGFDLQYAAGAIAVTWYTYEDDGTPVWYQAAAPAAATASWQGVLNRFTRNPTTGRVTPQAVGSIRLDAMDARHAKFSWQLGTRSGQESVIPLLTSPTPTIPDRTGIWYDPTESGWGLSLYTEGSSSGVVVYFYDADQQPRWVLGAGSNTSAQNIPMLSFRGFCPDCTAVPTTSVPGGDVALNFSGTRSASLSVNLRHANQAASSWQRGPVAIVPLSNPALRPDRN